MNNVERLIPHVTKMMEETKKVQEEATEKMETYKTMCALLDAKAYIDEDVSQTYESFQEGLKELQDGLDFLTELLKLLEAGATEESLTRTLKDKNTPVKVHSAAKVAMMVIKHNLAPAEAMRAINGYLILSSICNSI